MDINIRFKYWEILINSKLYFWNIRYIWNKKNYDYGHYLSWFGFLPMFCIGYFFIQNHLVVISPPHKIMMFLKKQNHHSDHVKITLTFCGFWYVLRCEQTRSLYHVNKIPAVNSTFGCFYIVTGITWRCIHVGVNIFVVVNVA